ncbi:MAG: phage Gp37/Gp68 family protein [Planctomycetes bacterium]|nr:phage Gp37/Gp68 family protein [Planctomycetota bacterium]
MALHSAIEWTEATWNPVTGCTKISLGCRHCYAERLAMRLKAMGNANYADGFRVALHEHMLSLPLRWKQPRVVFVNSMSDLFHEEVSPAFISRVFDVVVRAPQHVFQVLTKRSRRLAELAPQLPWPDNVWMGVTVEHPDYIERISDLRQTGARIKFLSLEPLLGPIPRLDLRGMDWVIVGGESGPGARPMRQEWATDIRDQCLAAGVPFFFKQWGGTNKKKAGRLLEGRTWDQMPEATEAGSLL